MPKIIVYEEKSSWTGLEPTTLGFLAKTEPRKFALEKTALDKFWTRDLLGYEPEGEFNHYHRTTVSMTANGSQH